MQHQKLAALFGCIAGIGQAAPSPAAAATTGFSSECSDIILNANWLVANCLNDAGTSVSSGVYLPSHVTNTEGKLKVYQFNVSNLMISIQDPKDANNLLFMFTSGKRSMFRPDSITLDTMRRMLSWKYMLIRYYPLVEPMKSLAQSVCC